MAGWVTRAASAFGRRSPPPPQAFDLPCDCGERLAGWRTAAPQKLNCTHCDRPVLVLPTDVYPPVKRSSPATPIKSAPAVVQPESRLKKSSARTEEKAGSTKKGAKGAEANSKPSPAADERINLAPMLQQGRARRRSLRLVAVCILALVFVTGWSLRNRTLREKARAAIPEATENGLAALRAKEFSRAVEQLGIATAALDTLHQRDAAAATIRQAQREAIAAQGLASVGIVEAAEAFLSWPGIIEERQRRFHAEYGSQWFLFDVGVVNRFQEGQQLPELEIPLSVKEGQKLQIVCDFHELHKKLQSQPSTTPVRMIFAAQLDRCQDAPAPAPIVVKINPQTAFLWSDYESYRAVGYEPASEADEAETRALLNQQRPQESAP